MRYRSISDLGIEIEIEMDGVRKKRYGRYSQTGVDFYKGIYRPRGGERHHCGNHSLRTVNSKGKMRKPWNTKARRGRRWTYAQIW